MLKITAEALQGMLAHCQREYPNEACGYLAGMDDTATHAYVVENDHHSPTSYYMNSAGQVVAQQDMRNRALKPVAIYHSHVATEAYPSRRDIENALTIQELYDGLHVLVSLKNRDNPKVRAFKIHDGFPQEVAVEETQR